MNAADQKRAWRISTRLKQARASAKEKLSQAELARRVEARGISKFPPAVASRIELGYTYATWEEVEALAAVLGVDAKWLAGTDDAASSNGTTHSKPASGSSRPEKNRIVAGENALPPTPAGISAAAQARPPSAHAAPSNVVVTRESPAVVAAVVPPPTELPAIPIPARGDLTISDYKIKLGLERRKTEELMGKPGLTPAEWRQQREYTRALTELLRTLVG